MWQSVFCEEYTHSGIVVNLVSRNDINRVLRCHSGLKVSNCTNGNIFILLKGVFPFRGFLLRLSLSETLGNRVAGSVFHA